MITRDFTTGHEAEKVRSQRRALAASQKDDPLAKRAASIAFWKRCSETNRGYIPHNGAWWGSFIRQTWGRRLLMPKLAAMLEAREREHREAYRAELRAHSQAWERKKALRAAEKAAAKREAITGQRSLLEARASC